MWPISNFVWQNLKTQILTYCDSKTQIVIVVIVAVVVIVPLLVKTTWHLDNRCDILRAAFRDSRDVFKSCFQKNYFFHGSFEGTILQFFLLLLLKCGHHGALEQCRLCPQNCGAAGFAPQNHRAFVLCPTKSWRPGSLQLQKKVHKKVKTMFFHSISHPCLGLIFFQSCNGFTPPHINMCSVELIQSFVCSFSLPASIMNVSHRWLELRADIIGLVFWLNGWRREILIFEGAIFSIWNHPFVIIMGGGGGQILTRTTKIGPILKTKTVLKTDRRNE